MLILIEECISEITTNQKITECNQIHLISSEKYMLPIQAVQTILKDCNPKSITIHVVPKLEPIILASQIGYIAGIEKGEGLVICASEKIIKQIQGLQLGSTAIKYCTNLKGFSIRSTAVNSTLKKKAAKTETGTITETNKKPEKNQTKISNTKISVSSGKITAAKKKILDTTGIEPSLYELILEAITESSDANIGYPLVAKSKLINAGQSVNNIDKIVDATKKYYDKLKK